MKKNGLIVLGIVLLFAFCGNARAISSDIRDNYERGETIIGEITGNILDPISASQVEFRRGHVLVPFDYDLKRLGGRYFIWANAPETENNYTLIIKDISTTVSGKTTTVNYEKNFSVGGNLTDYSIKPGFILSKEDFKIEIQLNLDNEKTISSDFPNGTEIILRPGGNDVKFSVSGSNGGLIIAHIGKYNAPIFINGPVINNTGEEILLSIDPLEIDSTIFIGSTGQSYPFHITNRGTSRLDNIRIEYNEKFFSIEQHESIALDPQEAIELKLNFIGEINDEMRKQGIEESLNINSGAYYIQLPVLIKFTENQTENSTPYLDNYESVKYCSELNGKICTAGEVCSGETKTSLDGACCLTSCQKEDTEGSNSWIGWLIAGVVLIVLLYVYSRYKKTKSSKGLGSLVEESDKSMGKP